MKRTLMILLALPVLLLPAACAEQSIDLYQLLEVENGLEAMLARCDSFYIFETYADSDEKTEWYVDSEIFVYADSEMKVLCRNGVNYWQIEEEMDGECYAQIPVNENPQLAYFNQASWFYYLAEEEITQCREENGMIYLTTSTPLSALEIEKDGYSESTYIIDAQTHVIQELHIRDILADGTVDYESTLLLQENAARPESILELLEFAEQADENPRNITVVINPGTEDERSFTSVVPKGGELRFSVYGQEMYMDAACTQLCNEAEIDLNTDLTVYVASIEE